ncbi:clasp N terminal-domain-containing protein [Cladochytrium replicatum]|nr:clasp N terminal-domain-containing protein [Cladochytrium replicatum]
MQANLFRSFVETLSHTLLNHSNEKLNIQCLSFITSLSKSLVYYSEPASVLNVLSASVAPAVVLLFGDSRSKIREGSQKACVGIYAGIVKKAAAGGGSTGAEGSVGKPYASMLQVLNTTIEEGGLRIKYPKAREQALLCLLQCHTKVEQFPVRIFLSSVLKLLDDSSTEVRSTAQEVVLCVCNSPKNNVPEVEIRRMVKDLRVSQANASLLFNGLAGERIDVQTTSVQPPTGGNVSASALANLNLERKKERRCRLTLSFSELKSGKEKGTPLQRTSSLPSSGEFIEPLNVYALKELGSIFESILHDLSAKETEENWAAKTNSLTKLRRLLRGNAVRMGPFVVQLKQCFEPICNALQSPRMALLKPASVVAVEICERFGNVFEQSVAETLLSTAHKLCSQTNKVVIQAGQDAASGIMVNINFGAKNMLILEKPFQSVRTTRASQRLSSICIARTMVETSDAVDREVREQGRCLFLAYQRIWKDRAAGLLPNFEPAVRKAISTQKPAIPAVRIASLESVTKPSTREASTDGESSHDSSFASYETPRRSKSELPLPRWQTETKQTRNLRPRPCTGNLIEVGSTQAQVRASKHASTVGPETLPDGFADTRMIGNQSSDSEEVTPKQSTRITFDDDEEVEALDEMRLSMLAPASPIGDTLSRLSTSAQPVAAFNPQSTSSSNSSNPINSEQITPRAPIRGLEDLQSQLHEVQTESTEKLLISVLEKIEKGAITERLVRQMVSIIRDNKVQGDGSGSEDVEEVDRDALARARRLWANQLGPLVDKIRERVNQSSTVLRACLELLDSWEINMRLQKDVPRLRRNLHKLNSTDLTGIETPARYHPPPTVSVYVIIGRILPRFGPEELIESDLLSTLARIGVKGLGSKIAEVRRTALSCLTELHEWMAAAEREGTLPSAELVNDSFVGTDHYFHRLWIHHVIREQQLSLKEQLLVRIQMMRRQFEEKDPNIPELLSQPMCVPLPA